MKLINKTNKKIIAEKVIFAESIFAKFRGLMFCRQKDFDYALVFDFGRASKRTASIHMFFVFFPIDVIYLRDGRVVDIYKNVAPFTPYLEPKERADVLVEVPKGSIEKGGLEIGHKIATL